MTTRGLKFREGFDWGRVAWGRPDAPARRLCAYCSGLLIEEEVQLEIYKEDGSAATFCEECVETWLMTNER
jgi:hypothetical protein